MADNAADQITLVEETLEEPIAPETEEQALALNADGLRYWLRQVIEENVQLRRQIKLSREARLSAAEICRRGTPTVTATTATTVHAAEVDQRLGKRSKKRKAALEEYATGSSARGQQKEAAQQERTEAETSAEKAPSAAPPPCPSAAPQADGSSPQDQPSPAKKPMVDGLRDSKLQGPGSTAPSQSPNGGQASQRKRQPPSNNASQPERKVHSQQNRYAPPRPYQQPSQRPQYPFPPPSRPAPGQYAEPYIPLGQFDDRPGPSHWPQHNNRHQHPHRPYRMA